MSFLNKLKHNKFKISWLLIALVALVTNVYLYSKGYVNHQTFGEWDGVMHYYAGSSIIKEGKYIGWASHYWPPLQPILLNIGNPFFVGKAISSVSGFLVLLFSFLISMHYQNNKLNAFLTSLFIFSNFLFFQVFLLVENHAIETAFIFMSVFFILKGEVQCKQKYIFLAGIFIGLACMSRYTSFSIVLSTLIYLWLTKEDKKYFLFSYLIGFFIICMPWFIQNLILNGSPIHTWQFINIAIGINGDDFTNIVLEHDGLFSVFSSDPISFIINYLGNLLTSAKIFIASFLSTVSLSLYFSLTILSISAFYLFKKILFKKIIQRFSYLILTIIFYIAVASVAFVFPEALSPMIFMFLLIVAIIFILHFPKYKHLLIFLIFINLVITNFKLYDFIENDSHDTGQLSDLKSNLDVLKNYSNNNMTIGSLNPAIGYYSEMSWVFNTPIKYKDLCHLVDTEFSKEVLDYFPYFPNDVDSFKKDFIYFTRQDYQYTGLLNDQLLLINPVCKNYEIKLLLQTNDSSLYMIVR